MNIFQFSKPGKWITTLMICLVIPLTSQATTSENSNNFNRGWEAYDRGNFEMAQQIWEPLARQGYVKAQINLGIIYDYGKGVKADPVTAAKWYREAAQQGNMSAQFNLGQMYAQGRGLPKDINSALQWYRKAAAQDFAIAQYNLGVMYDKGTETSRDEHEAIKWFYKAGLQFIKKNDLNWAKKSLDAIKVLSPAHHLVTELEQKIITSTAGSEQKASLETRSSFSSGTAWPVSYGYAVTNNHVVDGITTVKLINVDGEEIIAKVVLRDTANDLAFLSVGDVDRLPPALPLSENLAGLGASVFTIGYPRIDIMGKSPKLTDGIISSVNGMRGDTQSYQISVPVQPGNSGGPLLNMHGEVVGIVTSMLGSNSGGKTYLLPNISYALKVNVLRELMSQLPSQEPELYELPNGEDNLEGLAARIQKSVLLVMTNSN